MTDTQYLYQYFLEQSQEDSKGSQGIQGDTYNVAFESANAGEASEKEAQYD